MRIILITLFCATLQQVSAQGNLVKENGQLSVQQSELVKKVLKYHKDLKFTSEVTRHYAVNNGKRTLVKTTINYKRDGGLYYKAYMYYSVEFSADNKIIRYSLSAGRALTQEGTVQVLGGTLVRNDFTFGTSRGTTTIWADAKKVFETSMNFR